jgi:hypothetical protein
MLFLVMFAADRQTQTRKRTKRAKPASAVRVCV